MIEDHYTEDDDDFEDFLQHYIESQFEIASGDFRLVLEDEIIFGLGYAEALDLAKAKIAAAGFTVWDSITNDWTVEYFVEENAEDDMVLWATVESELEDPFEED